MRLEVQYAQVSEWLERSVENAVRGVTSITYWHCCLVTVHTHNNKAKAHEFFHQHRIYILVSDQHTPSPTCSVIAYIFGHRHSPSIVDLIVLHFSHFRLAEAELGPLRHSFRSR
jgi:hypothetical protein